ncbi:uncharacterized protein Tco025E_03653 [Trypanosoma conorhini]|uniref:Uncharacterized protein n=1 Tax=Trypanosoma conorhini TaxID=83891 RepID=A0A3R7LU30_9TRYP|nr:uncharacterized protein Tco025E_03653 [Trypanosoma conorhini]RNF20745.1 hypothetical protein Tco025E_03653 [Trypanosoma conorhini]
MHDEGGGDLPKPPSNPMSGTTPKRRVAHVVRREPSVSSLRPAGAEKSLFCKRTGSVGGARKTQTVTSVSNASATRQKPASSFPRPALMRNNSTNGDMFRRFTSRPPTPPPTNPKQVEGFLHRMREDEARCTKLHELLCESRGIPFHASKRSYSRTPLRAMESRNDTPRDGAMRSRSSTPARNVASSVLRRCTGSSDKVQLFSTPHANGKVPMYCRKTPNVQPRAVSTAVGSTPGAPGGKRTESGLGTRPKEQAVPPHRPVISVTSNKGVPGNGVVGAHADRVVLQGKSSKRQQASPPKPPPLGTPLSRRPNGERQPKGRGGTGAMSPQSISSRRMNCRTETAPYIESAAEERSRQCSPRKLVYDVTDESPARVVE